VNILRAVLRFFSSLRLTVALLAAAMILIFAATFAQVDLGIHEVQRRFIHSFIAFWEIRPGWVAPLPGGWLVGGLLLANLLAAHAGRFRLNAAKFGILLIHAGLVVLIVGELFSSVFSRESQMRLDEGETKSYSEAFRGAELVFIDGSAPDRDRVVAIPEELLKEGGTIQHPALPFTVKIVRFMPNSEVGMRDANPNIEPLPVDSGIGLRVVAREIPRTVKQDERDIASVVVELADAGQSYGRWFASSVLGQPQSVTAGGKTFRFAMRAKRYYQPFEIKLLDFSHDRYLGTDIPKNFSSLVRLRDPGQGEDREALIYMNHPLRHGGLTFYQASFANEDRTSIFQVVRNPFWRLPYIACVVVSLGLFQQFGFHLAKFVQRKAAA
jgi:hypothetical protein